MGNLYVVQSFVKLIATGGAAGTGGTGGSAGKSWLYDDTYNYCASGGGGGGGAALNTGSGGPGGGGGASGNLEWAYSGYYVVRAPGGNGGQNGDGTWAGVGVQSILNYNAIQNGQVTSNYTGWGNDDDDISDQSVGSGGAGGATGGASTGKMNNVIATDEYGKLLIYNATDWDTFSAEVANGNDYNYDTFKLMDDISVTTPVGTWSQVDLEGRAFRGTFNGCGHTLTFNASNQSRFTAPFKYVNGATIKDLKVAGSISGTGNADGKLLAGLVGQSIGNTTITNCISSVALATDYGDDAALAGLVAATRGGSVTISGCVFNGSMTGATNTRCAGIAGYEYEATTTNVSNSLFAPSILTVPIADDGYTKTFSRDADATITNCYYTEPLGEAQGMQVVALATAPDNLGEVTTAYNVSDITVYDNGLKYDGRYNINCIGFYDNAPNTDLLNDLATTYDGKQVKVALPDRILYRDENWNTLCLPFDLTLQGSPLTGAEARTLSEATFKDGTLTLNFGEPVETLNAGTPYIIKWNNTAYADLVISNADEWDNFASAVNGGNSYRGKIVVQEANIEVSTMVGTSSSEFKGTFDGRGHTLTFNKTATGWYCAPFSHVEDATIMNLHTAGTITTSAKFSAGLVGYTRGTTIIRNCWSSVNINSSVEGDGTYGGFVAMTYKGNTITTLTNCLFDGNITGADTHSCGGLFGWNDDRATLTNCVFRPASINLASSEDNATFSRGSNVTVTNCYYSEELPSGTGQGTEIGDMTNEALLAALGSGWKVSESKLVPDMAKAPDIVDPIFNGVTVNAAEPINITPGLNAGTDGDCSVTFVGTYDPVEIGEEGDHTKLYFSDHNTLYWPNGAMTITPFRAYLQLNGASATTTRSVVLNFGEETTAIEEIDNGELTVDIDDSWYTISGVKLDGKPSTKGVYIHGGRKVMMK